MWTIDKRDEQVIHRTGNTNSKYVKTLSPTISRITEQQLLMFSCEAISRYHQFEEKLGIIL